MRAGLVDHDRMCGAVARDQRFDEHGEPGSTRAGDVAEVADDADLPEHERARLVHVPVVHEKVRRFVALAPVIGRVDAEVREQAVLG